MGLLLVNAVNTGWILSFSNLIMWPLGWTWGIICLLLVGLYTAYANWLLAAFHFVDNRRFIRYRDLMGYVYGNFLIFFASCITHFNSAILTLSRQDYVPHNLGFPVFDPSSWRYGFHPPWRQGT